MSIPRRPPRSLRRDRSAPARRLLPLLSVLAAVVVCCSPQPATLTPLPRAEKKTPVVFVPGVTGSKLRDVKSGRTVFGLGSNVIVPHDGGYGIALPISAKPDGLPALEAFAVVDRVRFAFHEVEVFGPLMEHLQANGYRQGDLDAPVATADLFPFPYDWRQDAVLGAGRLAEQLDRLRRVRREEELRVALICQSTGAYVCRYLLKYGGAPLADAEAGRAGPLPWLRVTKAILISSSNGGSIRTLRELDRGRRYVRVIGRVLEPEVFFTFRSLYQDLPCLRRDLFVDLEGRTLRVDVCDPADWERYGWSVFGRDAARRLERDPRPDLFGSPTERRSYLATVLERAVRFQRLLRRDIEGFGATRYFLIQDGSLQTPDRAVLARREGEWTTLVTGDALLAERPDLLRRVTAMGDGHATRASQLWLSPQELAAMPLEPFYVEGGHFALVHDPATRAHLLEVLERGR